MITIPMKLFKNSFENNSFFLKKYTNKRNVSFQEKIKEKIDISIETKLTSYRYIKNQIADQKKEKGMQINTLTKPIIKSHNIIKQFIKDTEKIAICYMSEDDLYYVMNTWVLQEGWYPTQCTVEPFFAADPKGYYLLFLNEEPVASIAAVRYPQKTLAFIGLYRIIPELRKKHYAKLLWDEVTRPLLQKGYTFGLNAVPDNISFYNKSGFQLAYLDEAWSLNELKIPDDILWKPADERIKRIERENLIAVIEYDKKIFGADRSEFLSKWINKPETYSFAYINENQVEGYGVMSKRVSPKPNEEAGFRIGPVYASNPLIVEHLLKALVLSTEKRPVVLDVPGNNRVSVIPIMRKFHFEKRYEMANMYTKLPNEKSQVHDKTVYAKTSLTIAPK